jgi:hypothetical protein
MGTIKPNRVWSFLKALSVFNLPETKNKGARPDIKSLIPAYDKKEKIEKLVSDANRILKQLFNQTINPFYKYTDFQEYRTKFQLKPESPDNYKKDKFQHEELDENRNYEDIDYTY